MHILKVQCYRSILSKWAPPFILWPLLPLSWVDRLYIFNSLNVCLPDVFLFFYSSCLFFLSSSVLSSHPPPVFSFLPPSSINHTWLPCLHVHTNGCASVLSAGPWEELADEHNLHGGMPCQLPAFWVVCVVRVFTNMWPHRLVCTLISIRQMVTEHEIKCPSCFQSHQIIFSKVDSGSLCFQNIWEWLVLRISSGELCVVPSPNDVYLHNCNISRKLHSLVSLKGKMIRRRTVTQPFQGDGRPCPALMEQSKPCPVKPCYRWQYGQWSPCQVQVSNLKWLYGNVHSLYAGTWFWSCFTGLTHGMFPLQDFKCLAIS